MSLLEGFSHIVLTAKTPEGYDQCIKFYNLFGFQIISQDANATSAEGSTCYLHLFGKPPAQAITLKIVLSSGTKENSPFPEERDWRLEPVVINTASANIAVSNAVQGGASLVKNKCISNFSTFLNV